MTRPLHTLAAWWSRKDREERVGTYVMGIIILAIAFVGQVEGVPV